MTTTHTNSNADKKHDEKKREPPAAAAAPPAPPAPATAAQAAAATPPAAPTEPAKPVLTKEQKRAFFITYAAADAKLDAAKAQVEVVAKERSVAVKAILDNCGSGPFNVSDVPGLEGTQLTAAKRGDNYYFRSKKDREVETI